MGAFAFAVAGSLGGIVLIWGKPSGTGSGAIVVVAFVAAFISVLLAAFTSYRLLTRMSLPRRHLAFPILALAFSLLLSVALVALLFLAIQ